MSRCEVFEKPFTRTHFNSVLIINSSGWRSGSWKTISKAHLCLLLILQASILPLHAIPLKQFARFLDTPIPHKIKVLRDWKGARLTSSCIWEEWNQSSLDSKQRHYYHEQLWSLCPCRNLPGSRLSPVWKLPLEQSSYCLNNPSRGPIPGFFCWEIGPGEKTCPRIPPCDPGSRTWISTARLQADGKTWRSGSEAQWAGRAWPPSSCRALWPEGLQLWLQNRMNMSKWYQCPGPHLTYHRCAFPPYLPNLSLPLFSPSQWRASISTWLPCPETCLHSQCPTGHKVVSTWPLNIFNISFPFFNPTTIACVYALLISCW